MQTLETGRIVAAGRIVGCLLLLGASLLTPAIAQPAEQPQDSAVPKLQVESIETGLLGQRIAANDSGTFACVFGQPAPDGAEKRHPRSRSVYGAPTHVAIIDLVARKVLATRPIDGDVEQALMDDKYLYWKPASVNTINRLSLSSQAEFKETPLQVSVQQMLFLGGNRLALVVVNGEVTGIQIYDRESLKIMPNDLMNRFGLNTMRRRYGTSITYLGDGELHMTPLVLDQESGRPKCVVDTLFGTASLSNETPSSSLVTNSNSDSWWRRSYSEGQVRAMQGGATLLTTQSRHWCVSPIVPLWACLQVTGYDERVSRTFDIREVVYGKKVAEAILPNDGPYEVPFKHGMQFSGRKLVAVTYNKLAIAEVNETLLKTLVEPLRLVYPRVPLGATDKPLVFKLEAKGGKAPYAFLLAEEVEGIAVDEKSGEVRVDMPGIFQRRTESVAAATESPFALYDARFNGQRGPARSYEAIFERLTGVRIAKGQWPATIALRLAVADGSGQRDEIQVMAIAMAPLEKIEAANTAASAAQQARHEKMVAQRQGAGSGAPVELRVIELEKRMRRMEAQLDAILEKLDAKVPDAESEKPDANSEK